MEVYDKKKESGDANISLTKEKTTKFHPLEIPTKKHPLEIPLPKPEEKSIIEQPSSISQEPAKIDMECEQRILSPKVVCSMEKLCGDYNLEGDYSKKDV